MEREPPLRRYPKLAFLRPKRYPIWSVGTVTLVALLVVGITAALVLILGHKSIIAEFQITTTIVALCLFVFLTIGLYRGIRFKKQTASLPELTLVKRKDIPEMMSELDISGVPFDFVDDLGALLGTIVAVIVGILMVVLLAGLLWLLVNFFWAFVVVLGFAIYYVFHLALRRVFVLSRFCQGRLGRSLGYAAYYTAAYTFWLFGLLAAVKLII